MLNLISVTTGILIACLVTPGFKAVAANPHPTKSDKTLYAQGVFDFNNRERQLRAGQGSSPAIDGPNPKPYTDSFSIRNPAGQLRQRSDEWFGAERQFYYFYPNRWPETPKEKK